jgi:hypothetical protein
LYVRTVNVERLVHINGTFMYALAGHIPTCKYSCVNYIKNVYNYIALTIYKWRARFKSCIGVDTYVRTVYICTMCMMYTIRTVRMRIVRAMHIIR